MSWEKVAESQGLTEAEILRSFLESNGIPVELKYESIGKVMGITTNGLGVVKILVPEEREEEAKNLIESVKNQR
ncbi:MAG: putative signal transducing protein [Candidatus Aminicenantia bacterium]